MRLKLLYFAWVQAQVGKAEETLDLPPEVKTVGDLVSWLASQGEGYAEAFAVPARLRAARNQVFCELDTKLESGDELALFPPVTGG